MMTRVTCCFAALRKSVSYLKLYYTQGARDTNPGFPFWNRLQDYNPTYSEDNQQSTISDNNNTALEWVYKTHLHPHKHIWHAQIAKKARRDCQMD